jgi:DNA invertase Pin-like site-specific DNA recombinase
MPSTNGHVRKLAIPYARVSTQEQARSGYSLAQQLEACRAWCATEGYEVLEEVQILARVGQAWRVREWIGLGTWWLV